MKGDATSQSSTGGTATPIAAGSNHASVLPDEELALGSRRLPTSTEDGMAEHVTGDAIPKHGLSSWTSGFRTRSGTATPLPMSQKLEELVSSYESSDVARKVREEVESPVQDNGEPEAAESRQGYRRASWWTQFTILSGRAFKNLYRNPLLMLTHYAISILVASTSQSPPVLLVSAEPIRTVICSFLFNDLT